MAVGDSLLVAAQAAPALRGWMARRGWKSVQRAEEKQIRVWRIS